MSSNIQTRVRCLEIRAGWGCNKGYDGCNFLTLRDNHIMYAVGSRVFIFDCSEGHSSLVNFYDFHAQIVYSFHISQDLKYVAVCVLLADPKHSLKASILVYNVENIPKSLAKPTLIEYDSGSYFYTAAFSHCGTVMAASLLDVGVLVYERFTGHLRFCIPTESLCTQICFHRTDKTRLCFTGKDGLFQFVRCSSKAIHSIPVSGVDKGENYTCHEWLSDSKLVAGTISGLVYLISGDGNQLHERSVAFPGQFDGDNPLPVLGILVRSTTVIVSSSSNKLVVYDIKSSSSTAGRESTGNKLQVVARVRLNGISEIITAKWATFNSSTNLELYVSSSGTIYFVNLQAGAYTLARSGVEEQVSDLKEKNSSPSHFENFIDHSIDKTIFSYHSSPLCSLSVAAEYNLFVTTGTDSTIRVWNYGSHTSPTVLVDKTISSRTNEIPICVAFHPSGLFIAVGSDDCVYECQLTDTKLESIRQCMTRSNDGATTSNAGGALQGDFFNYQPVSSVRYSHGGHLLAAVTGRLIQVFGLYCRDFRNDSVGTNRRIMVLSDHKAGISDFSFSLDDRSIYTCSVDGTVYGWALGLQDRNFEYVARGFAALRIVADSPSSFVVASFSRDLTLHGRDTTKSKKKRDSVGTLTYETTSIDSNVHIDHNDTSPNGYYLAVWTKSTSSSSPEILFTDTPVTSIAFGKHDLNFSGVSQDFLVCGCADGKIIVAFLPLAKVLLSSLQSPQSYSLMKRDEVEHSDDEAKYSLDLNQVASLYIHSGEVKAVAVSPDGAWILSAGQDGAVFMTTASVRSRDSSKASVAPNQTLVCTDRVAFFAQKSRLEDLDSLIRDTKSECEKSIKELTDRKNGAIAAVEARMKNEVEKRDDIIHRIREDSAKQIRQYKEEAEASSKRFASDMASLEYSYEKRLAQEVIYVNKMKQAFDEVLVNAKLDSSIVEEEITVKEERLLVDKRCAFVELENQKRLIKSYCDYVKARNNEVIASLEDIHEEDRLKWRESSHLQSEALEYFKKTASSDIAALKKSNKELNAKLLLKDDETAKVRSDLSWANTRLQKLEETLLQATLELKQQTYSRESWEVKCEEYQKQIRDLELVRQSLTAQLHILRSSTRPQQEKLIDASDKLANVTSQYEASLKSLAEKESKCNIQAERLRLLQKQLSDLRISLAQKDKILKRAAKLVLNTTSSAAPTRHNSTLPQRETIEELCAMLQSYVNADDGSMIDLDNSGVVEQEAQKELLHRNVAALKSSLDLVNSVSDTKVRNHLSDNFHLLKEVNELRKEMRSLAAENHRLVSHFLMTSSSEAGEIPRKKKGSSDLHSSSSKFLQRLSKPIVSTLGQDISDVSQTETREFVPVSNIVSINTAVSLPFEIAEEKLDVATKSFQSISLRTRSRRLPKL